MRSGHASARVPQLRNRTCGPSRVDLGPPARPDTGAVMAISERLFQLRTRIKDAELTKQERVAVERVGAALGHDVDPPSGRPAVLDRPTVRDDLKLSDEFQRE